VYVGAATNAGALNSTTDRTYKTLEQAQFDIVTAENACKFGPIHPQRDLYDWAGGVLPYPPTHPPRMYSPCKSASQAPGERSASPRLLCVGCDLVFSDAAAANQSVRGHNLCWHTENPNWLINGNFTPTELTQILQEHIATVVAHYGTHAESWDVVNEALDTNGLKPSAPWYPAVPNYIDVAFRAARKAGGPNVKLFYNDYSVEAMNAKVRSVRVCTVRVWAGRLLFYLPPSRAQQIDTRSRPNPSRWDSPSHAPVCGRAPLFAV
jgi:hypothetical protein